MFIGLGKAKIGVKSTDLINRPSLLSRGGLLNNSPKVSFSLVAVERANKT